jgi:hypothetical protein
VVRVEVQVGLVGVEAQVVLLEGLGWGKVVRGVVEVLKVEAGQEVGAAVLGKGWAMVHSVLL